MTVPQLERYSRRRPPDAYSAGFQDQEEQNIQRALDSLADTEEASSVFNVKAAPYKAKGDKTQDDSDRINAAIGDSIAAGGQTYLPGVSGYYKVTKPLIASLTDAKTFSMIGDGLRSLIYSTTTGDVLTVDGTPSATGRTVPNLRNFAIAGGPASQDGVVLNATHRGTLQDVFVIACGGWGFNYKACFLNKMFGGGTTINVGAIGNIPTQRVPKGGIRFGSGTGGGGSNANSCFGSVFEGCARAATVITDATNAAPIVVSSTAHGCVTGDVVGVTGVVGNTAANAAWIVTVLDADHLSLDSSTGNGAYVSGGSVNLGVGIHGQAAPAGNSYAQSFFGGTAENNNVGTLIGPGCTIWDFQATDITSNYIYDWQDRGANNSWINSGAGGAIASFGYGVNVNGALQILGSGGQILIDPTYGLRVNNALHNLLRCLDNRDVIVGDGAIATNATGGFLHMSGGAGAPSGVPANAGAGVVPLYYDTTNNFLYVYNGGAWKRSTVYA